MRINIPAFFEDMESVCATDFIPWDVLRNKTIFITGGTGLIGSTLIRALLYANLKKELDLKIFALVRNLQKAKEKFSQQFHEASELFLIQGTIENLPAIDTPIDYIIHGASQTASKVFVEHPVETILTAVYGTENILRLAREKQVNGMVYLSSMEIYGHPQRGHKVTENEGGMLSPLDVRNSYPLSKQLCENMCCAYAKEYSVPAKIIRLTQTFGPGVQDTDQRIFAEFARCIKGKHDIVLKTRGETERSYLYTADAVTAILCVLLKGKTGQAYNAANEKTYCSIAQMAQTVAEKGGIHVRYDLQDASQYGYAQSLHMDLNVEMLKDLGWNTMGGNIWQMYEKTLELS